MPRPSQREMILNAAARVVVELGAAQMSLDAVAQRAGISKGGLLYHFHSKDDLLRALIGRVNDGCRNRREEIVAKQPPGAWRDVLAGIELLKKRDEDLHNVAASLTAVAFSDPKLSAPIRADFRRRFKALEADKRLANRKVIYELVGNGLVFMELLGLSPLSPTRRTAVIAELKRMVEHEAATTKAPAKKSPRKPTRKNKESA